MNNTSDDGALDPASMLALVEKQQRSVGVQRGAFAAIIVSAVLGIRGSSGVRGTRASSFTGTVYGVTWSVASLALLAIGGALFSHGMTAPLANYYYPVAFIFLAGLMYVLAGAIWHSIPSAVGGGILILVAAVGGYLPYPLHYLFFAIAGGGTFLALAAQSAFRTRRLKAEARGQVSADG